MSITVAIRQEVTVLAPVPASPAATQASARVRQSGFNTGTTLAANIGQCLLVPLVAGVATLDLTSFTGLGGVAVDATGEKLHCIKINNKSAVHPLTVGPGDSNGLGVCGGSATITLPPLGTMHIYHGAGGPTVGSGAKNLKLTDGGNNSTTAHEVVLVFA